MAALQASSIQPLRSPLRRPRLRASVNGLPIGGAIAADVFSNNHYAADRFILRVAVSQAEAVTWSSVPTALVEIQASLDMLSWTSLVQGEADQLVFDPLASTLTLTGRDLTARFIESRTEETFANQTSSDIAALLASRHGLDCDADTTTTPAGAYWQIEHDAITLGSFARSITEWDLLVTLAGHEGFDVWVSGSTLHFKAPNPDATPPRILRSQPSPAGLPDFTSLHLEHTLTLAGDVEVVVKSWNSRHAQSFIQTARRTRADGTPRGGYKRQVQRYVYVVPNLTTGQALKLAQNRLAEISQQERILLAEMPGELALLPRSKIQLTGTGTAFDQEYVIDEINRHISFDAGFTQMIRAVNRDIAVGATSPAEQIGGSPWSGF